MAVVLLLALVFPAVAEQDTAYYNPENPPPFAREHAASGDDYFADAVFIGDSIMESVEMFDLFPTANIVCRSGFSPHNAHWRVFRIRGSEDTYDFYQMTEYYPHAKIYIMLGGNSLDNKISSEALEEYEAMIDEMIQRFPQSLIYIISPPPMTREVMKARNLGPLRYSKFRDGLLEMAREKNLYFIDYYAHMVDAEGYMIDIYDGGDGGHPSKRGLQVMENLVRTHTVEYQ